MWSAQGQRVECLYCHAHITIPFDPMFAPDVDRIPAARRRAIRLGVRELLSEVGEEAEARARDAQARLEESTPARWTLFAEWLRTLRNAIAMGVLAGCLVTLFMSKGVERWQEIITLPIGGGALGAVWAMLTLLRRSDEQRSMIDSKAQWDSEVAAVKQFQHRYGQRPDEFRFALDCLLETEDSGLAQNLYETVLFWNRGGAESPLCDVQDAVPPDVAQRMRQVVDDLDRKVRDYWEDADDTFCTANGQDDGHELTLLPDERSLCRVRLMQKIDVHVTDRRMIATAPPLRGQSRARLDIPFQRLQRIDIDGARSRIEFRSTEGAVLAFRSETPSAMHAIFDALATAHGSDAYQPRNTETAKRNHFQDRDARREALAAYIRRIEGTFASAQGTVTPRLEADLSELGESIYKVLGMSSGLMKTLAHFGKEDVNVAMVLSECWGGIGDPFTGQWRQELLVPLLEGARKS